MTNKKLIEKKGYTFNITKNPGSTFADYDNLVTVQTVEEAVKVNNLLKLAATLKYTFDKYRYIEVPEKETVDLIYKFIKENYPQIEFEEFDEETEYEEEFNKRVLEDYFTETPLECLYNWSGGLHKFEYYTYYCPEDVYVEMIEFD
jgi:hypothetical protein